MAQTSVIAPQVESNLGLHMISQESNDMWDLTQTSVIEPQGGVEPETASEHDR